MSRHQPQAAGIEQDKVNADFFVNQIDHNHRCFDSIFIHTHTHTLGNFPYTTVIFHSLQSTQLMSNHPKSDRKHHKPLTWHGMHSLQTERMKRLLDKDGRQICSLNGLARWLASGRTMLLQWSRKCRRRNPRWKTKTRETKKNKLFFKRCLP